MSILSDFEDRVASAIEGLFAGAFRSPVQPAEIARALAREMDGCRVVGVGKVYVPNGYIVVISEKDEERMEPLLGVLSGELATYLAAHADERGYEVSGRPLVRFEVDDDYRLGFFTVERSSEPSEGAPEPERGPARTTATVTVSGVAHDVALLGERVTVGRLADCGIVLSDSNVSRVHAAFVAEGPGWAVEDLGSTNGTFLNGRPAKRESLRDGDVVQVGVTKLAYHAPKDAP